MDSSFLKALCHIGIKNEWDNIDNHIEPSPGLKMGEYQMSIENE